MSIVSHESVGPAGKNAALEVMQVDQPEGRMTAYIESLVAGDAGKLVLSFHKLNAGSGVLGEQQNPPLLSSQDTAVSGEDTAYDGNDSTLVFSGEALNNLPIVPRSVLVTPTSGGSTVNAFDRDGDGKLYTADVDEDPAGTIDYFTGDLELSFPLGKEPNTTNILADYTQSLEVTGLGKVPFVLPIVSEQSTVVVTAAAKANGGKIRCDVVVDKR